MTDSQARSTVYESAVDWWLALLLISAPILSAVIGIYLLAIGRPADATWLFITGAVIALVTAILAHPCRYTILDDALSIRCGVVCYQVSFSDIDSVEKTNSIGSGPSLSTKRVCVTTKAKKKSHLISPKQREEFIRDLRSAVKKVKKSPA